jgi:hypothetical protein
MKTDPIELNDLARTAGELPPTAEKIVEENVPNWRPSSHRRDRLMRLGMASCRDKRLVLVGTRIPDQRDA